MKGRYFSLTNQITVSNTSRIKYYVEFTFSDVQLLNVASPNFQDKNGGGLPKAVHTMRTEEFAFTGSLCVTTRLFTLFELHAKKKEIMIVH